MTADSFREARRKSGLSASAFGYALGYRSKNKHHVRQQIYDMEAGRRPLSPQVARLAEMFRRFGVPKSWEHPR